MTKAKFAWIVLARSTGTGLCDRFRKRFRCFWKRLNLTASETPRGPFRGPGVGSGSGSHFRGDTIKIN